MMGRQSRQTAMIFVDMETLIPENHLLWKNAISISRFIILKICDRLETVPGTPEQIRQYTEAIRSFLSKSEKQQPDLDLICDMLRLFQVEMDKALTERYNLEILEDSYKSYQI